MGYSITKTFKLDMGHRIPNFTMKAGRGAKFYKSGTDLIENKCANIHGHSLQIHVTIQSDTLDSQAFVMNSSMMKVGFSEVINRIDHAFVMDKNDPLFKEIKKITDREKLRLHVVDFPPTFEALAKYFHDEIKQLIRKAGYERDLIVKQVKITGHTVEACYFE